MPSSWPGSLLPGGTGLDWLGYKINGTSHDAHFQTQNNWDIDGSYDEANTAKVNAVKQYLDLAAAGNIGRDKIFINFLSRAAGDYVGSAAQVINDEVLKYLSSQMSNTTGRIGMVPIDFVANTGWNGCLEDWIIRRNTFKTGYTFTYAIDPFKLGLALPGEEQQWWLGTGEHNWAVAVPLTADLW